MQKILWNLLLGLFLLGCEENKENTLVIATSADYPPFEFYKNGEPVGFEIELIQKIAEKLGKKPQIKDISFDGIIAGLQSNRYDLAISAISSTPEREQKVDFCKPHNRSVTVMILPLNSTIKTPTELTGKTVGVQMGTTYENMIRNDWMPTMKDLKVRSLQKVPDLLQDFRAHRIDALVLGMVEGQKIVDVYSDLKMVPITGTEAAYCIAVPKGSELKEKINVILDEFHQQGVIKALEEKWLHGNS